MSEGTDNPAGIRPLPYPSASGTYRVPIHDLVRDGHAKQVGPNIWEMLEDVEVVVEEGLPLVMTTGSRWASADYVFSKPFMNLRLQLFN